MQVRRSIWFFPILFLALGCQSLYRSPEGQASSEPADTGATPLNTSPKWNVRNSRPQFDWPVDEARLTRGFIPQPKRGKRPHLGIDLAAGRGTPILSAHDGTVIYVGKSFRGFGKMIMVEDRRGFASIYAHLSKVYVREGEQVRQGEHIGAMGRTGRASGVHLHFEIRTAQGPIDPLLYLPNGSLVSHK